VAPAGQGQLELVWLDHLDRRTAAVVRLRNLWTLGGQPRQPVAPAEDERDNVLNVAPHVEYVGNALYEYLPGLSRGSGEPQPTARLEFMTVDLLPGAGKAFEAALATVQSTLQGETLWYRMIAGGTAPRYVRLRPRPGLSAILDGTTEEALPGGVNHLIAKTTVEILTLRPTMSLGLELPTRK
jgi:hypothetical protein